MTENKHTYNNNIDVCSLIKFKTNQKNMRNKYICSLFEECESLKSLPDISKWNTNKVTNMNNLFYNCKSLESLPDISKWNTNKVTNMNALLYNCESLKSLPDISK